MGKTMFKCDGQDCVVDFDGMYAYFPASYTCDKYPIKKDSVQGWLVMDIQLRAWEKMRLPVAEQIELLYTQHLFLGRSSIKPAVVDKICLHPNKYELTLFTSKSWHCPDCDKEVT